MKNKLLQLPVFILVLFIIGYASYQAFVFFYNPYETEITVTYSVNEEIHVDGLAVRTETVMEDQYGGSVSYIYEDAQRVLRNKPVAYSHASADTVSKMIRAQELEKEIGLLEEAAAGVSQLYGSSEFINDQIASSVLAYAGSLSGGDYSGFVPVKDELLLSINKKTAITGKDNKFAERIALLRAEFDEIQADIEADEASTVLSPKTGYFISSTDGFEQLINKEDLFIKTVAEIEEIINKEVVTNEQKLGKIADNYKWFYVISVSPEDAERFVIGKSVTVNFDGVNEPASLEVYEKIEDESSENIAVVLECRTFTPELASLRQVSADIVFSTISGLRISSDSIRFNDEQEMGVFVLEKNEVVFRTVDIIYTGNGYNVVKWNQGSRGTLQLFDEVFIGGNDLYEGKVID